MKFTSKQLKDYMSGRLKLNTNAGKTILMPAKPRPYDRGITPPDKRAYWRVWYLKNRDKRKAYSRERYNGRPDSIKAVLSNPSKHEFKVSPPTKRELKAAARAGTLTKADKKAAYAAKWRKKNLAHARAYGKKMYHLKYSPAAKARALLSTPRLVSKGLGGESLKPRRKPKSLLQRLFGVFG